MNLHSDEWRMERRAERTAETRERIERAALHHFVHQGIAETSIRDIADKAHVSLGAMYNHFDSKEELAWRLFIEGWDEIGRELRRRGHGETKLAAKLESMIAHVFRRFDEDSLLVTYIFSARHQHLRRITTRRGGGRDNPYTMFRLVIAQAMGRGEIPRGDLDLKTALVVGAIIQAIDSRMLLRLKGSLADAAPAAARLCYAMLSG
jgi:AcrR family transcriptional regulator